MPHKLSIDLNDKNLKELKRMKTEAGWPYGNTINNLLELLSIPKSVKEEFYEFTKTQLRSLYKQADSEEIFGLNELNEKITVYTDIAALLNNGVRLSVDDLKEDPMKKIKIKNGYLIVPSDWIDINPDEAEEMPFAGVIECRNSKRYGIPHFLFHTHLERACDYDSDEINKMCVKVYPEFKDIMNRQVTPEMDPEHPTVMLNEQAFMDAPTIGHFSIYVQDDPLYGSNYKPPAGAKIVRTNV